MGEGSWFSNVVLRALPHAIYFSTIRIRSIVRSAIKMLCFAYVIS